MFNNQSASYYEGRIKTMSQLLNHVSEQVAPSSQGSPESPESQAYYHIATLLTRGCDDDEHARDVIAVTGVQRLVNATTVSERLDSDSTQGVLPSSPDIDSRLFETHITVAQNQPLEPSSNHTVTRVRPSETPVHKILKTVWFSKGKTPVSLEQHAEDIFGALASTAKLHRSTDGDRYTKASYLALSLIIGRSFPKISRRVQAIQHLFTSKFLERLARVELRQSGDLVVTPSKQVGVCEAGGHRYIKVGATLKAVFLSNGVPCEIRDGICYFLFHISSAMLWIKTLVSVYNSVKASTQKRPTKKLEWHALNTQLMQLHRMVYVLGDYYDAILGLPDLVDFLRNNLKKQCVVNDSYELSDGDESDEDATADTLSDIGSDDCEPAAQILMCFFRAIVAWNQAHVWLDSSKVFRSPKGVTFLNIIKIQVSMQQKKASTPIRALLDEYTKTYNVDPKFKESLKKLEKRGNKFAGTVHAEAILMALINECSNPETTLPQDLVYILKDANRIGVAKKCCWLCKQLGEAMRVRGQIFNLPGTSGIVFSWAPPMGLDITVLQQLEDRLKNLLFQYLTEYANRTLKEAQSHQSSPAISFMDGAEDEEAIRAMEEALEPVSDEEDL